jgi:hypothetical protein
VCPYFHIFAIFAEYTIYMQWAWHLDPYFKYHSSEQQAIMKSLISIAVNCAFFFHAVSAQKYVFAHVVVGDTAAHTLGTWASDIALSQAASIVHVRYCLWQL